MAGRPRRKQRERLEREAGLRPPLPVAPSRPRRLHTFVIPGAHGDPWTYSSMAWRWRAARVCPGSRR